MKKAGDDVQNEKKLETLSSPFASPFSLFRARKSLSLARARAPPPLVAMPPNRLPLPVRPDVYPLLGALALATAGALSFSFLTLRKTFRERSQLQEEGKRGVGGR